MKKIDIKNDPIRDFLVSAISKLRDNSVLYLTTTLLFVGAIIALAIYSSKSAPSDKVICLDDKISESELFKAYCESSLESVNDVDNFVSTANELFVDRDISIDEKIIELKKIDIDSINSPLLQSLFFREVGEVFLDVNDLDSAIEYFSMSESAYSRKDLYFAKLSYSFSLTYFEKGDYDNSSIYIDKALDCNFTDSNLEQKIKFLKGKILRKI